MQWLCKKMLAIGGKSFCPGDIIPEGVIFPERSGKLLRSGHISKINPEAEQGFVFGGEKMFPESKVKEMIAHEVAEAEQKKDSQMKELKEYIAELQEMPSVSDGVIQLEIKGAADELAASVSIKTEEVQQVFSIMQLNAEEGVKAINAVKSEDVLLLLHATDSRKTIQNAARERAEKLFLSKDAPPNEIDNGITKGNAEGEGDGWQKEHIPTNQKG